MESLSAPELDMVGPVGGMWGLPMSRCSAQLNATGTGGRALAWVQGAAWRCADVRCVSSHSRLSDVQSGVSHLCLCQDAIQHPQHKRTVCTKRKHSFRGFFRNA